MREKTVFLKIYFQTTCRKTTKLNVYLTQNDFPVDALRNIRSALSFFLLWWVLKAALMTGENYDFNSQGIYSRLIALRNKACVFVVSFLSPNLKLCFIVGLYQGLNKWQGVK